MFVTCRKNQEFILFLCFIHFCIHPPSFFPLILSVHSGIFCLIVECKLLRNKTKLFFLLLTSASELYTSFAPQIGYQGIWIYQSKNKALCCLCSLSHEALAPIVQHNIRKMSKVSFLEFQYNLSKRKFLRKPTRMFSSGNRQNSSLLPGYMPNPDELKQVFDKFDSNKDGKISPDEYKAILRVLGKENMIKEVSKIFEVVDLDGDGFIDFREFVELHKREGGVKTTEIQCAFRTFDLDGDGKISAEEVFELLKRLGEKCSLQDCRRMVRAVDANGDGVIDMDEFITMMTRTMKLC